MATKWTPEIEQRFTELRLRQLSDNLTQSEQQELAEIRALVVAVESDTITPALQKLESEQAALQQTLESIQVENNDLVQLFNQQALLIADTKRWIREFEQRYSAIQSSYKRLSKQSMAV